MIRTVLLAQPRWAKQWGMALADTLSALVAVWVAFSLRLDVPHWPTGGQWWVYALSPFVAIKMFYLVGVYRAVFRYVGLATMRAITLAVLMYGVAFGVLLSVLRGAGVDMGLVPRSVPIISAFVLLVLVAGSRAQVRLWLGRWPTRDKLPVPVRRLLIYGAGASGVQTLQAMATAREFRVLGFVDDSPELQGRSINGLKVFAPAELPEQVQKLKVDDVVLALPSVSRAERNAVLDRLKTMPVHVHTLPGLADLAQGRVSFSELLELDIDDLLGREPVPPDAALFGSNIAGRVVMVTGAGGSIGSELCRQIITAGPTTLLLVEMTEFALYNIDTELQGLLSLPDAPPVRLVPLLASVRDHARMAAIMQAWRPATVYHAAAYKHVPLVEHNPCEGIRNNVFGTLNTALAAVAYGVRSFVLVSTDKAVRPTNIMGASKRLSEMVLQALGAEGTSFGGAPPTCFSMVRFGNVLGSSGSVVPRFREQIEAGGPITLTHADITRFFMTIPEAAQLVIQAGAMARGGDVFVLDMGEPIKIIDLARRIVQFSGLTLKSDEHPEGDIGIEIVGLRPGEKLYEELLIGNDPEPTQHRRIMKAREDFISWPRLEQELRALSAAMDAGDVASVRQTLRRLVDGYQPTGGIVDWLHEDGKALAEAVVAQRTAATPEPAPVTAAVAAATAQPSAYGAPVHAGPVPPPVPGRAPLPADSARVSV